MKPWKTAARAGALVGAAVIVAAFAPPLQGQAREQKAARALDILASRGLASRGGEIGVSVRDVDSAKGGSGSAPNGVLIEDVSSGSPAEKAGIKKGDLVVEFDGERVRSVRQFMRLVQETPPGRRVAAALARDGQRVNVTVEPRESDPIRLLGNLNGARVLRDFGRDFTYAFPEHPAPPTPPPAPRSPGAPPAPPAPPVPPDFQEFFWSSGSGLGITVTSLSSQLADYFGAKHGVLVTAVQDNSAAQAAGFKAGDVVTALNGEDVSEPGDLRRRTGRLQDGDEFTAAVMRDKKPVTLKGKIERRTNRSATRVRL
jgi:serine protease Do